MSYKQAYEDRVSIVIDDIESDGSGEVVPSTVEFTPRDNPDISVDTSGRFSVHNIIGGDVVRQKIGNSPLEIEVSGVCDEQTARQIDQLRAARLGTIISDRVTTRVQFASMSSEPMESGGAADMDTGDYLYTYTINMVSVDASSSGSSSGGGGGGGAQLET